MEGKKKGKSMLLKDVPPDVSEKILLIQANAMVRVKKKPNQHDVVFEAIRAFPLESK